MKYVFVQYAESLLVEVSTACDNVKYAAWLASETIKHLKQNITGKICVIVSDDDESLNVI